MEESATTAEDGEAIVHDNEMAAEACEEPTAAAAAEAELPEAMDGGQFDALKETLSRVKEVSGVSDDLLNEVDALKIKLKKKLRKASGKDHKAASVPSNTPGVQQGAASSRKKCGKGERQTEVPVVELEMPPADVNGSLYWRRQRWRRLRRPRRPRPRRRQRRRGQGLRRRRPRLRRQRSDLRRQR